MSDCHPCCLFKLSNPIQIKKYCVPFSLCFIPLSSLKQIQIRTPDSYWSSGGMRGLGWRPGCSTSRTDTPHGGCAALHLRPHGLHTARCCSLPVCMRPRRIVAIFFSKGGNVNAARQPKKVSECHGGGSVCLLNPGVLVTWVG